MGENTDGEVSRAAEGFLRNHTGSKPFFLALGFLQPHDICYWIMRHTHDIGRLPIPELAGELPPLPPNFNFDEREPDQMIRKRGGAMAHKSAAEWSELHWRYYLWSYYRHVEMVDAEVGRVLAALEDSAFARDTLVIFNADHGEGMASHRMVTKGYLYDEAARVPLVICWPGELPEGKMDTTTLVSGMDFAPTVCDYAGVAAMPKARGLSLRPLLEGRGAPERAYVAAEAAGHGQLIRTARYKYICYPDDPVCQLFDVQADPWETKNLAGEAAYAAALGEMKKYHAEWDKGLEKMPGAPVSNSDEGVAPAGGAAAGRGKAARRAARAAKDAPLRRAAGKSPAAK
ncbi:MAG: sulfatase-like hydrolase/transferase [bacterium]|nr:sulfatase-like hydrolase/transferase [bacterium]